MKNQISNELHDVAILLEAHVKQFLHTKKQTAFLVASDNYIMEELKAFNNNVQPLKYRQIELCRYLYDRFRMFEGLWSAILLDKNGVVMASSNNMHLDENWSDSPFYSRYKAGKYGQFVSDAYFSEEYQHGFIDFAAPVREEGSEGLLGVIIMKFDKSELDKLTTGDAVASSGRDDKRNADLKNIIRKGATREAYLVNKDKRMITTSRFLKDTFLKLSVNTEAVNYSLSKKTAFSGTYNDYRSKPVMGISMFIEEPGWALLVETDLSEALIPVKKVRYVALIAIGSGLGCLILLTATFRTVKHIILIEDAIKNISKGDLHAEYDFQSDELGSRLSASFNEMTAALKKSKEVLRNLFDAANDPMFLIKEGELIEDMNKRVTEMFGYKKESLPGNNFTSILTTKYIPTVKQAIAATWNLSPGQKYPTFDVAVVTRDNRELICELDINRTDYGIQPHFRDATEARRLGKRLEEKNQELENTLKDLKETQAQLVQSGKLAGIGELASGVAHEINNPLTAVMGHSLRLLRKAENNEVLKTMKELDPFRTELKIIADASARCKRITDGLLRFSRMSPELKVSSISINDVIADTLVLIEYNLKQKNIKLVRRLEDGSKYIKGDHNQLQQVFTNMINNAIHAMPNGGSLTIAARETGSPQPPIKSRRLQADKYIEIEFADTGCGIEKEHVSRIFDPFFTTKEPGKGTGLGLSISYSIIKDHGGWIDVKSEVGKGTSFLITLPAV